MEQLSSGDVIKKHRKILNISQTELAKLTGITSNLICKYETNVKQIGSNNAARIALALEIKPELILWPKGIDNIPEANEIKFNTEMMKFKRENK